jgi:hypothetical protein
MRSAHKMSPILSIIFVPASVVHREGQRCQGNEKQILFQSQSKGARLYTSRSRRYLLTSASNSSVLKQVSLGQAAIE